MTPEPRDVAINYKRIGQWHVQWRVGSNRPHRWFLYRRHGGGLWNGRLPRFWFQAVQRKP